MSWLRKLLLAGFFSAAVLSASPLVFRTAELPWAAIGADYRAAIETQGNGRCPLGDVTLVVTDGALPAGLRLEGSAIAGVPRQLGISRFRLRAANNCAAAERDYQLQVTGKPLLRVYPEELMFAYTPGDAMPEPRNVLVSSTWPELPYRVAGETKWLRVRERAGITPFPGSAFTSDVTTIEIAPQELKPGDYETVLTFFTPHAATPSTVAVKLRVAAPAAPQIEK